jgi:nitroimidazol reductase NimA-like FMN-containing flavoprotein (pyridoxamine 5'-phosphate oxidase superfamily)
MTTSPQEQQRGPRFTELPLARCEELLAAHTTGRVAWNAPEGPEVLPVTYAYDTGRVVFRTSPFGALSQLARGTTVAFEIDDVNQEEGSGWSVLVRGVAAGITEPHDLVQLWTKDGLVPWATGIRNLFIAITPRSITGRAVRAPYAD